MFGVVGQSSAFDSIAMRDAQDRASTLSTIDEATAMLHRANHTGDEMLAKATAHSAFDLGWTGVANQYADATGKREALDCLTEANEGRYSRLVDSIVFGVRNPAEFESATEPTLRQFANVHAPGMEKDSPQQPRSPIPAAFTVGTAASPSVPCQPPRRSAPYVRRANTIATSIDPPAESESDAGGNPRATFPAVRRYRHCCDGPILDT